MGSNVHIIIITIILFSVRCTLYVYTIHIVECIMKETMEKIKNKWNEEETKYKIKRGTLTYLSHNDSLYS